MSEFFTRPLFEVAGETVDLQTLAMFVGILAFFFILSWGLRRFLFQPFCNRIGLEERFSRFINLGVHLVLVIAGFSSAIQLIIPQTEAISKIQSVLNFTLFSLDKNPISLAAIIKVLIILVLFMVIARLFERYLLGRFFDYIRLDPGVQFTFTRVVHYLVLVIGVIIAFQSIGINFTGLAVIFGFLSVGIGFGLQNVTSNFVAGLILLFERPIRVGDRVTIGDLEGDINEINIRSTRVQTVDNITIIVPNSDFVSTNVINWTHGDPKIRLNIDVGVSYNSDLDTVIRCLKEVAKEEPEVLNKPEPEVLLRNFGDSAWDMRLNVWINNPKRHRQVRSKVNCAIVRKFRENNVEIPFPQRDINFRNPLSLPDWNGRAPRGDREEKG